MKSNPNQVHMAPFDVILAGFESCWYQVWEASGMPPGPQNPSKNHKISGFGVWGLGWNSPLFPIGSVVESMAKEWYPSKIETAR